MISFRFSITFMLKLPALPKPPSHTAAVAATGAAMAGAEGSMLAYVAVGTVEGRGGAAVVDWDAAEVGMGAVVCGAAVDGGAVEAIWFALAAAAGSVLVMPAESYDHDKCTRLWRPAPTPPRAESECTAP